MAWKVGDRAEFREGESAWAKGTVSGFDADGRPQVGDRLLCAGRALITRCQWQVRPDVAGSAHVAAAADNIITADELRPIRVTVACTHLAQSHAWIRVMGSRPVFGGA